MHSTYNSIEFDSVEFLATSGGLGTTDSDDRMTYYGMSGLPSLVFNGGNFIAGAGLDAINGSAYDPIVQSLLDDSSPVKMAITSHSFDMAGGHVTVDVELEGSLAGYQLIRLRTYIVEDHLSYESVDYHHVLRKMLPDQTLSISNAGESEQITINFDPDAGWNPDNLRLIAFIQAHRSKEVLQTCNSLPTPDYALRYYAEGDRIVIGSRDVDFDTCALFNAGTMADTYDVTLDTSGLPAGWSASFDYEGTDYTSLSLGLAPDERALFNVTINTPTVDEGEVELTFHSQSGQTDDRQISYKVISPDVDILLVDDDGAATYDSQYFVPAIAGSGKSVSTWNRNVQKVTGANLANFDMVIWECGIAYPTVDDADRDAMAAYLDGGGNLFITGQDIGWELFDVGGAAINWYRNYLHANYVADDTDMLTLTGVVDDPITDGLVLHIDGGDGASNQEYPSDIDPWDEFASTILTYDANRNGGIKADDGNHKVVYLSFGFEGIDNATDREALMHGIIDWMLPGESSVGDDLPTAVTLRRNVPNPFNPMTAIKFNLGRAAEVRLGVYDVKGRQVRVLDEGLKAAGEHSLMWDGCDDAGHALPSGNYFCRIDGAGQNQSIKMMLVR